MNPQEEALLKLVHQQNVEKRQAEQYETDCKRVTGGFLSAVDVVALFKDANASWPESPGAEARRLIAELNLPFMEIGPGRFMVGHEIRLPRGKA